MTELEQLRAENEALYEALGIIAKNLTNDDGIDPYSWHLELTADEAAQIRAVVEKNKAIPFPGQSPENRCKHGILAGHCPDCPSIEEIEANEREQAERAKRGKKTPGTY